MALAADFEQYMWDCIQKCREFNYNPAYWKRMIIDHGAVDASHRLLTGTRASDGFTRLWEEDCLELSVEFSVLLPKYHDLFTDDERAEARRRLELYEFDVDGHLANWNAPGAKPQQPDVEPPEEPEPAVPERPVVVPVVTGNDSSRVRPSAGDLAEARQIFGRRESRDIFYRAATFLVEQALEGQAPLSLSEALLVLLQTWNRAYYQYHPPGPDHLDQIDALLEQHASWRSRVRNRTIDTFSSTDARELESIFADFEKVLGPVGAAKALHLLAPRFLPLWDRAIATAYGLQLGYTGSNGRRYVRMAKITRDQSAHVGGVGTNIVKALDEYNYCRFTKGWI
jgi:hypothetical protein